MNKYRKIIVESINAKSLAIAALLLGIILLTVYIHGFYPSQVGNSLPGRITLLGDIRCGSNSLIDFIDAKCDFTGGDTGGLLFIGFPVSLLGALIDSIPFITTEVSVVFLAAFAYSLSVFGFWKLSKTLNVSSVVGVSLGVLYINLPSVIHMQPFGGTYWGMVLLPFFVMAIVHVLISLKKAAETNSFELYVKSFLVMVVTFTVQLFIDGYSFFMTASSGLIVVSLLGLKYPLLHNFKKDNVKIWFALASILPAIAIAAIIYKFIVPITISSPSPEDLFRAMGADLITFIKPTGSLWWPSKVGIDTGFPALWGDGTNALYNYLGISTLAVLPLGVYFVTKRAIKEFNTDSVRISIALFFAMGMAFVFSLGPSLKLNEVRPAHSGLITFQQYLMPENAARFELPTAPLFTRVDGLSSMRATYRWNFLTQMCLLLFAGVAVSGVMKYKNGKKIAGILLVVIIAELSPNIKALGADWSLRHQQLEAFNNDIVYSLDERLDDNEKVLFYPNSIGGNDYLVNYISPYIKINTYNVGGDKSNDYTKQFQPIAIQELLEDRDITKMFDSDELFMVMKNEDIDTVVMPNFDLRWDSYSWPPSNKEAKDAYEWATSGVKTDARFKTEEAPNNYYLLVKLR